MRIALLSDVHGNAPALRAVLEDAKSKNVEEFWFLGDVLGYGPLPVTCLNLLADVKPAIWLAGNHDRGALRLLNGDSSPMEDKTVRAMAPGLEERYLLAWHALQLREGLESEQVEQLKKLPTWQKRSVVNESIYAVHGAILDSDPSADENIGANAYCNAGRPAAGSMLDTISTELNDRPQLVVVGHTHVSTLGQTGWEKPRRWQWTSGKALYNNPNKKWMWASNEVTILCPGSVGQPRGGQNKEFAYYALLNTEEKNVWFRQVAYHRGEFLAAMALLLNPDTGQVDSRKIRAIWEYILDANA